MIKFDIVTCLKTEGYKRQNIFKRFVCFIKDLIKRPDVNKWVDEITFDNGLDIGVIKIPYDIEIIKNFSNRRMEGIVYSIYQMCESRSIECCIIPQELLEMGFNESVFKKCFSGRFIFKSVLIEILNKISIIDKKRIDDLDVVIVNGNRNSELLRIVSILALNLKYLTIVFKDDNLLENEIESIFESTGTAIGSTNDTKKAIRNADVIINLDDDFELPKQKLKQETVIINYSNKEMNTQNCHRVVINDVKLKLPKYLRSILRKDILDFFSETQLGEMIIGNMIESMDNIEKSLNSQFLDEKILRIIDKEGYEVMIT